jgi:hypothetical protein
VNWRTHVCVSRTELPGAMDERLMRPDVLCRCCCDCSAVLPSTSFQVWLPYAGVMHTLRKHAPVDREI